MHEHRGTSIAISALAIAFLVTLPFTVPTVLWIVLSVYAAVKAIGAARDDAGATAVLVSVVGVVTLFTLGIGLSVYALGRTMTPKSRKRRDAEERQRTATP